MKAKAKPCAHRRLAKEPIIEERYEPLFGVDVPVEVIEYRECLDCGAWIR